MTKASLLATAAVISIGATASAADLAPAPVLPAPVVFSWTGPYLGLATGYAWGNTPGGSDLFNPPEAFDGSGLGLDGWLLGGFAGYNYQFGSGVVVGAEADIEFAFLSDNAETGDRVDFSADMNWDGSIRSRIGYAFNRALIYGTGGLAVGGFHGDIDPGRSESPTEWGWTIGAGVDYAFTDRIFGRAEYRFTDFNFGNTDEAGDFNGFSTNTVRVGVGVKFW